MAVLTDEPVFVSDIPEPSSPIGNDVTWDAGLRWLIAGCSVGAAVVHFGDAPSPFSEYWLYGLFFVIAGWLQLVWAVAIVLRPSRGLLLAGALLSEAIIAVWVASRTVGVLIGPNASTKEAIGFPDVLCTVLAGVVAIGAIVLLAQSRPSTRNTHRRRLSRRIVGVALLAVAVTSVYALTPRFAEAHDHGGAAADGH